MSEQRLNGQCKCGRAVVKVLHSEVPTMWRDGTRYAYPEEIDTTRWCIFRCDHCGEPIDETFVPDGERATATPSSQADGAA